MASLSANFVSLSLCKFANFIYFAALARTDSQTHSVGNKIIVTAGELAKRVMAREMAG